jgi:hypothetical protein
MNLRKQTTDLTTIFTVLLVLMFVFFDFHEKISNFMQISLSILVFSMFYGAYSSIKAFKNKSEKHFYLETHNDQYAKVFFTIFGVIFIITSAVFWFYDFFEDYITCCLILFAILFWIQARYLLPSVLFHINEDVLFLENHNESRAFLILNVLKISYHHDSISIELADGQVYHILYLNLNDKKIKDFHDFLITHGVVF